MGPRGRKLQESGGASWFVLLTKCYSGDQIKKIETGWACGT